MIKKLYIDGCSLVYGYGLPRDQSLGYMFEHHGGYITKDNSRPGKSNSLIAYDVYQNYKDYDVFVLGFTYSTRFGFKYKNQDLDFYTNHHGKGFDLTPDTLDISHQEVQKYFFTVWEPPFCDNFSDMLYDNTISFLKQQNKIVLGFSWEDRRVANDIFYPYVAPGERLQDGHLNQKGTKNLYNKLQDILGNAE